MRLALAAAASVLAALLAVPAAGSAARPAPAALVRQGLVRAVDRGELTATEAAGYRATLANVLDESTRLPPLRADLLHAIVADVAGQWRSYTAPRALTLFSTLAVNADWLESHALVGPRPDLEADDGAVYRFFSGHGYVFHPLANFAKLNAYAAAKDETHVAHLAAALLARAVPLGRSLVWQYDFPFASGRPPWTSGMAQAVAAQAFARAGTLLGDQTLLDTADAAYAAVPRLLSTASPAKPWVALYSFDRVPVLNAQLQAALSLDDYAAISGSNGAESLAGRVTAAALRLLPSFDTGYWSLYSLRGDESPLDYHDYVIGLLRKLATRTGEAAWREAADRFQSYEAQPPLIRFRAPPPTVFPRPADGFRDEASIPFWLSKASTVTLLVGGRRVTQHYSHGAHTLVWNPGDADPGTYHPFVTVVGPAGTRFELAAPAVTVAPPPGPPPLAVSVTAPASVSWSSEAEGTPWLHLRLDLSRGFATRTIDLGRRRLAGTRHLRLPPGRWHALLRVANSAGRSRTVSLGYLPR
ncbi:MAG TPA: D-glucuronyl C5-epimerase family protein [Gaiellaceae bacterium]|nr:D-glucuronyl C5-epimerase family protein [Gaiellaceae bacterium]